MMCPIVNIMTDHNMKYSVFHSSEGSGSSFLGQARSLRQCSAMAAQHACGELRAIPSSDYDQERAAGNCGPIPPAHDPEPVKWFGRGGWYCAMRNLS